ncbi:GNAT family N-acetyltransferase [Sphingomonas sp. HITSZ_GF]|uniref:GNAT family N-acetyltransferase n=1 Tax=Sphingomonas sp. HITSZ_GF TaxID=3037247 RepID=UPI00240E7EA6|nr:GNAT family N-acetyltransferase [Sphingomonas sp. HITSZ_GF]MDG2535819.1 GNAT family N-acetyltransferase [Sphingomonas sp. HITSZ_GF]
MQSPLPPFPPARGKPIDDAPLHACGIRLRRAGEADLPALMRIHHLWRQKDLLLAPWTAAQKQLFLDDQFRLQHVHYVAHRPKADFYAIVSAERDGAVLGKLYLDRSAAEWRIVDLLLDTALRGRGVGTALIRWIQDAALQAGATGVSLQVGINNPQAQAFYERLGFVELPGGDSINRTLLWTAAPR